jgi:aspartyl-tRNA(Asn)/glutamyl-tRNA(Gln) amidotransferase subunit C
MIIDRQEVQRIAHLARLHLTEEELNRMEKEMNKILQYVSKLQELDTSNIEPMHHNFEVSNFFRPDEVCPSLPREKVLANAPDQKGGLFRIPGAISKLA